MSHSLVNKLRSLSVVIIAQNEERTLRQALSAIKNLATEIIYVDSGSTDSSIKIAESFGACIMHQPWLGYAGQKNFALDQSTGDWILSLDADEIVTPNLRQEILEILKSGVPEDIVGFTMPRLLYIGDKPVYKGGFYPDAQLRLIRKGKGRFTDRMVHESLNAQGKIMLLKNHLLHFAYKDLEEFRESLDKYARLSAEQHLCTGYSAWEASLINEWLHPIWTFLYRYFARSGFAGGSLCFKLDLAYSNYVRKKIHYLRQLIKKKP